MDSTEIADKAGVRMQTDRIGRWARRLGAALVAGLIVLLPAGPALAHGEGDSDQSRVLVLDALTYLVNKPANYMDMATDKVADALAATDTSGVDLTKVKAAEDALKNNDMMQTRSLLQASLSAEAGPVTGEDPGTTTVLDPLTVHPAWTGYEVTLAALSGASLLIGILLARHWRPAKRLRALRTEIQEGSIR